MKQSDINHLRRLLGWARTEIGQDPEALVETMADVAEKLRLQESDLTDAAKIRLVQAHDDARSVPAYIRAAVKALSKVLGPGEIVPERDSAIDLSSLASGSAMAFDAWLSSLPEAERERYVHGGVEALRAAYCAGASRVELGLTQRAESP